MSDRYYQQMLDTTGWCPGFRNTTSIDEYEQKFSKIRRKRKMPWTDEMKSQAVEMYQDSEPTPETSMEIVKEVAEELGDGVGAPAARYRLVPADLRDLPDVEAKLRAAGLAPPAQVPPRIFLGSSDN